MQALRFPAFGLNIRTPYLSVFISLYSVRMWENAGKMWTRITPNTDSLYAVKVIRFYFPQKNDFKKDMKKVL